MEEELVKAGYEKEKAEKYLELYREVTPDLAGIRYLKEKLTGFLDPKCAETSRPSLRAWKQSRPQTSSWSSTDSGARHVLLHRPNL